MVGLARTIVRSRELIWQLSLRNMKAGRKQSVLGLGWIVFQPLAQMAIFTVVFSKIMNVETSVPYPIWVFCGLVAWQFVSSALRGATESVVQSAALVRKIYFPREVLVLAAMVSALVNFAISFGVLLVLIAIFKTALGATFEIALGWSLLWLVPLLGVLGCLVLGLGLILATLNVFVRDVFNALPLFTQVWFYATPIVYDMEAAPSWFARVLAANPMTHIIQGFRAAILEGTGPGVGILYSLGVALALLMAGYWFFHRAERHFADVV